MTEAQIALIRHDEIHEAIPLWWRADDRAECLLEQLRGEAITEHRGVAEQRAISWCQSVDASCNEILERFRDLVERTEFASGMSEFEQEQRVAACPGTELLEFVVADLGIVGQLRAEVLGETGLERTKLECAGLETQAGTEPLRAIAGGQAHEPRLLVDALHRSGEQLRRGLVHPHRIFDHQHQRLGKGRLQHR